MSGKRSWSLDATSFRPRPQGAPPTSAAPLPNASTSRTGARRRASLTPPWLSPISASLYLARERRLLTPSARWTRTSTVAWWDGTANYLDLQCLAEVFLCNLLTFCRVTTINFIVVYLDHMATISCQNKIQSENVPCISIHPLWVNIMWIQVLLQLLL